MKFQLLVLFLAFLNLQGIAQIGGDHTFEFLNLPGSGRNVALGGQSLALWEKDLNLVEFNPAALNESMSGELDLNYSGYFAGIKYGNVAYAHDFNKYGIFSILLKTIDYGDFIQADQTGEILGTFTAAETVYQLNWAMPIDSVLNFGASFKIINSNLENYYSSGLAGDLGLFYHSRSELFNASLALKNIGMQLQNYYTEAENESLPFEIELALSKRLSYAPFRFHLGIQHMEQWDLSYSSDINPTQTINPLTGEVEGLSKLEKFSSNALKHLVLGVEFMPSDNFFINVAYNNQRRSELKIDATRGMVGFSFGFGMNFSRFSFSFGRAIYHLAGAANYFSLSTNLNQFIKK